MDLTSIIADLLTAIEIGFITTVCIKILRVIMLPPDPEVEVSTVYIRIEELLTGDTSIYLVSDAETTQFICQGSSADDIRTKLIPIVGERDLMLVTTTNEKIRLTLNVPN